MIRSRRWRAAALVAHVTASVGWIGAVVASLGLAITALVSDDLQIVRSAYISLDVLGRFVLVPFAVAALLGGIAQSFITHWGLFRHYWVIFKLAITIFATIVLVMYTETLSVLAGVAANQASSAENLGVLRTPSVLLHASAALVLLLVATILAVYKPKGTTAYGQRQQRKEVRTSG